MSEDPVTGNGERQPDIPKGSFISVTLMQLENLEQRKRFMASVGAVMQQIRRTPGLKGRQLYRDPDDETKFYTATAWDGPDSMERFKNGGYHEKAMKHADSLAAGGKVPALNWTGDAMPTLAEIKEKFAATSEPPQRQDL